MTRSTAPLRCAHLALALVIAAPMLRPAFAASPESASRADVVLEKTFASSDDFEVCTRDAAIDATSDAGAIRLVDEDFIIHAQGDKLFGTTPKTGTGRKLSFSGALLFEPGEIRSSQGRAFRVFAPFWRAAQPLRPLRADGDLTLNLRANRRTE